VGLDFGRGGLKAGGLRLVVVLREGGMFERCRANGVWESMPQLAWMAC